MRNLCASLVRSVVAAYFELSYRLLAGSPEGRRFLRESAAAPELQSHGYVTLEDLSALTASLRPTADSLLLDLGCGVGDVAREVHARTGVRVVGVDVSARAVAEARRRADRSATEREVQFVRGSFTWLPKVAATGAYALDSLVFEPAQAAALVAIAGALGDRGRLFATTLTFGASTDPPLELEARRAGGRLLESSDVTGALVASSDARRSVARRLAAQSATRRGRTALGIVIAEESLVGRLARRGQLRRWRVVVEFESA
jgi:SAM-dependent methyltransferase